jgi:GNAT acetyltransferase-like protein
MSTTVRRYNEDDADAWDALTTESWNGTFLHGRRFLAYHGDRFQDLSFVVEDDRERVVGVFPAALQPEDVLTVVSHPGLTYGGLVHKGTIRGVALLKVLQDICASYREMGLRSLRYKPVPYIYHTVPSADDLYALFRLGAVRYRCDLSATIDLDARHQTSTLRRRDLAKARKAGLGIASGPEYLEPFWPVLVANLKAKHATRPVHTLDEITYLQNRFPEQIRCIVATVGHRVLAGIVLFQTPRVVHVQYSASAAEGNSVGASTAVMSYAIEESSRAGARYFDFGVSNEQEGRILNEGLYRFKASFGAGGVAQEFYEVTLRKPNGVS